MLVKILVGLVVVVGLFLLYVAFQPSEYMISRELLMKAPADTIFPHINDSKKLNAWMPWAESDPQMKIEYSGPGEGIGATSKWDSPGQMGQGQAVISESISNQKVVSKLTYMRPMEMQQTSEMTLSPGADGTTVRWSVNGRNGFMGRLFCVFVSMDKMVGNEFEKGLKSLQKTVEAPR